MKGYVGTYASTRANGVYQFTFDEASKHFIDSSIYQQDQDAKYLSLYKGVLAYPVAAQHNGIKMIRNKEVAIAGNEQHVSCYIVQDEDYIYTANYHDGTVNRYAKTVAGIGAPDTIYIQQGAGTHQVILKKDALIVPCRLLNCVNIYDRTTLNLRKSIAFPEDSGPRHGVLSKKQDSLYLVSENSCELFHIDGNDDHVVKKLSLLQEQEVGGAAAIRMSSDDRFLYISVRDINQIYVVDVVAWQVIQVISSGGDHPRDIAIDPSERFVIAANRFSNNLVAFARDAQSGQLIMVDQLEDIIEGVSIVFES